MPKEQVNHPSHYKKEGRKECIEEMIDRFGEKAVYIWCVLNAYKYRYRKGTKEGNPEEQDEKKAVWYLNKAFQLNPPVVPWKVQEYLNGCLGL